MKKIINIVLLSAFVTVLSISCNKDGDPTPPKAISFGNVATRVESVSEIEEFSVWATVSGKNSDGSINPDISYVPILEDERIYRDPVGSDNWTYDNTQNWTDNSIFYFFATYPRNLGVQQLRQSLNGTNYTAYSLNVTADGSDDTEDILVARNVTDTSAEGFNPAAAVDIQFGHLLTKVNVKISQNFDIDPDFNYYVTKVTLTGVKGNGTYVVLPYGEQFGLFWDFENASSITLTKEYAEPMILRNVGAADPTVTLSVWGSGLMLIPQEIAGGGIKIRVDYLYDVNLDDEDKGTAKFVEGYIPAGAWESGKSVSYSLAIANSSFISFDKPTIEAWGAPQTGGTIIIK